MTRKLSTVLPGSLTLMTKLEYKRVNRLDLIRIVKEGYNRRSTVIEFEEFTARIMALPEERRAELAEMLLQSIGGKENEGVKFAWLPEIYRRDQEIKAGTAVTKPADETLR